MPTINQFVRPPSPLQGLAEIGNLVGQVRDWSTKSKQADLLDKENTAKGLENDKLSAQNTQNQAILKALGDANSPETKNFKNTASLGLSGIAHSGAFDPARLSPIQAMIDDPNTTGLQIKNTFDADPNLKQAYSLAGDKIKGDAMIAAGVGRGSAMSGRTQVQASKDYDEQMKPYVQLNNDVAKLESALSTKDKNGNPLITKPQMGDANATIARIYSPNHMSDSTMSRTEYESAPAIFAGALQKWSADPTDIGSRAIIDHMIDQAHHLANVSNQNASNQLDTLDAGYGAVTDPGVGGVAKAKSKSYRGRFNKQYPTVGDSGAASGGHAPHAQDDAAVSWAKSNPNDPLSAKILKANGQ